MDSLLGVESDNEGWNVDDLLADSDVPLPDEDTGVVNRLGESIGQFVSMDQFQQQGDIPELEDLGLQSPLQEILSLQGKNVIEPHSAVVKHTNSD